jgi:hypothetical protein
MLYDHKTVLQSFIGHSMGLFVHGLFLVDFSAGFKLNLNKYLQFEATP